MRYVYLVVFLLLASLGLAQSLSVRIEFLPQQSAEEFCFWRLEAKSVYAIAAYEWAYRAPNGYFVPIPGATLSTVTANKSGDYLVRVMDVNGVTATSGQVYIYYGEPYRAVISAQKTVICPGTTVELVSNDLTSTRRYQWYRNGTPIGGATGRTYLASEGGTYSFGLTDAVGCTSELSIPVVITTASAPTGTITGVAELCPGTSNRLAVSTTGPQPMRYQWATKQGLISQATSSTHAVAEAGTYRVLLTDANGCPGQSPDFVVKQVPPLVVELAPIGPQCTSGGVVSLSGTPAGGTFGGPGVSSAEFNPGLAGAGMHLLTYSVAGTSACLSGTASQPVVVRAVPPVVLGSDLYIRRGASVVLPGPAGAGYQYQWTPAATLNDPAQASPTATPVGSTTYRLRVRDAAGCEATDTLRVYVQIPLYIPTAFTPNGDGVNDTWNLVNAADVPNMSVTVFNRWGNVVFNSPGYAVPFNGEGLSNGTYTYLIQYGVPLIRQSGTLVLLR